MNQDEAGLIVRNINLAHRSQKCYSFSAEKATYICIYFGFKFTTEIWFYLFQMCGYI
jgi:hypothetical protein